VCVYDFSGGTCTIAQRQHSPNKQKWKGAALSKQRGQQNVRAYLSEDGAFSGITGDGSFMGCNKGWLGLAVRLSGDPRALLRWMCALMDNDGRQGSRQRDGREVYTTHVMLLQTLQVSQILIETTVSCL
jgi:hypothetical protein